MKSRRRSLGGAPLCVCVSVSASVCPPLYLSFSRSVSLSLSLSLSLSPPSLSLSLSLSLSVSPCLKSQVTVSRKWLTKRRTTCCESLGNFIVSESCISAAVRLWQPLACKQSLSGVLQKHHLVSSSWHFEEHIHLRKPRLLPTCCSTRC